VFVWAPGDVPFELPSDLGFPLGPGDFGLRSFKLQIHYNNPELLENIIDNSGVRIYYAKTPRPIQAGIFEVGDPNVGLMDEPVGTGLIEHTFECGGGCSALALPSTGVTVIRSYLHMHKTGIEASNELIRDGAVVNTASVEFFDFAQQGNHVVQADSFKVLPGDAFRLRCHYRSPSDGTSTNFGMGSSDEMCVAFLLYYPRQIVEELQFPWFCAYQFDEPCSVEHSSRKLGDVEELGRDFGSPMQTDASGSFNNSLMCPLVDSPPLDNASSPSNDDDAGDSSGIISTTPFAAVLGSAIVSMLLLLS
jgi:Copper type II ascorbate-dependent monooxygenase, C-terminal domain/Copper type II ascorbate-dependent monooxygenase, N-terminal domain